MTDNKDELKDELVARSLRALADKLDPPTDIVDLRNKVCEAIGWEKDDCFVGMWRDARTQNWVTGDAKSRYAFAPDTRPEQLAMACVLAGVMFDFKGGKLVACGGDAWYCDPIKIMRYIAERGKQ